MNEWIWLILASGLSMGILLLPYAFGLKGMTWFRLNRAYLLAILGAAIVVPLTVVYSGSANWFTSAAPENETFFFPQNAVPDPDLAALPAATSTPEHLSSEVLPAPNAEISLGQSPAVGMDISWPQVFWAVYGLGFLLGLCKLSWGIFQVLRWYRRSPKTSAAGFVLLSPEQLPASFSFFRWLFLSPLDADSSDRKAIVHHEQAHIRQWHSLDVLLAELACCVWWCMPWFRYWRRAIKDNHEFLADRSAALSCGNVAYSRLLLARTRPAVSRLPVHFFARSKTQIRILMLNKQQSPRIQWWRYFTILPVLGLAFVFLACMPLTPDLSSETTDVSVGESLVFAGELFPEEQRYQDGLADRIQKLAERPAYCQKLRMRAARYQVDLHNRLKKAGLPQDFFYLVMAESAFDPEANSSMGACGPWQFLPQTARTYGMKVNGQIDERKDWQASTAAAATYLQKYQQEFGSWIAAALAFNRGPGPLRKFESPDGVANWFSLDHERGYLYQVLAMKLLVEDPARFGLATDPGFALPFAKNVDIKITSDFGPRRSPFDGKVKNHDGVDFRASLGTPVLAIADGKVEIASFSDEGYGNQIKLVHDAPMSSNYFHLDEIRVKPGQEVRQGDVIGTVGSTGLSKGPHLHLEIRESGVPVNPNLYLDLD